MKKLSEIEMKKVNGGLWFNIGKFVIGSFVTTFLSGFLDGILRPFGCR